MFVLLRKACVCHAINERQLTYLLIVYVGALVVENRSFYVTNRAAASTTRVVNYSLAAALTRYVMSIAFCSAAHLKRARINNVVQIYAQQDHTSVSHGRDFSPLKRVNTRQGFLTPMRCQDFAKYRTGVNLFLLHRWTSESRKKFSTSGGFALYHEPGHATPVARSRTAPRLPGPFLPHPNYF